VFSRKIPGPAIFDFCNTIGTSATWRADPAMSAYEGQSRRDSAIAESKRMNPTRTFDTFFNDAPIRERAPIASVLFQAKFRVIPDWLLCIALILNPKSPNAEAQRADAEAGAALTGRQLHVLNASTEHDRSLPAMKMTGTVTPCF
jgi:hypothetical protein